jgi:hypothetical protein
MQDMVLTKTCIPLLPRFTPGFTPGDDVAGVPRDQGFTRPKALILLPMRNMAFAVVRRLVALAQKETRADSVQVGVDETTASVVAHYR